MALLAKFELGQPVYHRGKRTRIIKREIIDIPAHPICWRYLIEGHTGAVMERDLISGDEPVLSHHQIDFDDPEMNNLTELVCPFCKKHVFEDHELFNDLEGSAELTCPVCDNQFLACRSVIFYYDLSQSEDEEYLQRVTEKDDVDDEQIDD